MNEYKLTVGQEYWLDSFRITKGKFVIMKFYKTRIVVFFERTGGFEYNESENNLIGFPVVNHNYERVD